MKVQQQNVIDSSCIYFICRPACPEVENSESFPIPSSRADIHGSSLSVVVEKGNNYFSLVNNGKQTEVNNGNGATSEKHCAALDINLCFVLFGGDF